MKKEFINRLEELRVERGMNKKNFAELLGVSNVTYSRYLNHEFTPDFDRLERVAKKLEVNVNWILTGQSPKRGFIQSPPLVSLSTTSAPTIEIASPATPSITLKKAEAILKRQDYDAGRLTGVIEQMYERIFSDAPEDK